MRAAQLRRWAPYTQFPAMKYSQTQARAIILRKYPLCTQRRRRRVSPPRTFFFLLCARQYPSIVYDNKIITITARNLYIQTLIDTFIIVNFFIKFTLIIILSSWNFTLHFASILNILYIGGILFK